MKHNKTSKEQSITESLLKDMLDRQKAHTKQSMQDVLIGSTPLAPSDLFQDDGSGYNADFVFPQD